MKRSKRTSLLCGLFHVHFGGSAMANCLACGRELDSELDTCDTFECWECIHCHEPAPMPVFETIVLNEQVLVHSA